MTQKEIGDLKREVSESSRSKYKHLEIAEMKTK